MITQRYMGSNELTLAGITHYLANGIDNQVRLIARNRVVALYRDDMSAIGREAQQLLVHLDTHLVNLDFPDRPKWWLAFL